MKCLTFLATVILGYSTIASTQPLKIQRIRNGIEFVPPLEHDADLCPQVQYTNQSLGAMFTPNFPANYPNSADCRYLVTGPIGTQVTVVFEIFELEVCCDFLSLYDGVKKDDDGNLIKKISGSHSNGLSFTTNSSILELHFTSDANFNYQGFYAVFTASQNTQYIPYNCEASNYTSSFGAIISPGFPLEYPANSDCTYLIGNGTGTVYLTVESFSTEPCCDHVRLYDGPTNNNDMIMEMSGTAAAGTTFQSTGGYIFVEFISDANTNDAGYSFKYQIKPSTEQSITTPKTVLPIQTNEKKP